MIEVVLAMKPAIEDAPPLANVGVLKADAQGIVATFACAELQRRRSLGLAA